jgi:hypothetical protein
MGIFDWETALNKNESLYFYPRSHEILGNFKIQFELSGTYNVVISDVILNGRPALLFEYIDEDDDQPARINTLLTDTTIESMIIYLSSIENTYHGSVYETVYHWISPMFSN